MIFSRLSNTCEIEICLGFEVSQDIDKSKPNVKQTIEAALTGRCSSKMIAILNELDEIWSIDPGSKVLVFSQYLGFLDLLYTSMRKRNIDVFRMDGTMSLHNRHIALKEFKSISKKSQIVVSKPGCDSDDPSTICRGAVMLASMKACGVGLNLVSASSVFIVDRWWNAAIEDQCVDRIHRIGQDAKVVRVRRFIVQDSVEERIVSLQEKKRGMANNILCSKSDGGNSTISESGPTLEDFRQIFQR